MNKSASLQLVHSAPVQARKLNQHERASIANRCLVFGVSRRTIAIEYGVHRNEIDDICDEAQFERGRSYGRREVKFMPPMRSAA